MWEAIENRLKFTITLECGDGDLGEDVEFPQDLI